MIDLYEQNHDRTAWRRFNLQMADKIGQTTKGMFAEYMHKCVLDRILSVKAIDAGTVSWWPTECKAYVNAYAKLWKNGVPKAQRFSALMYIHREIKKMKPGHRLSDTLAHTCWDMKGL